MDEADVIFILFTEAEDTAGADVEAGLADVFDSLQAFIVGAGGDD